jgi:hypothetical protein
MPLQKSGSISLTEVQKEFGGAAPTELKEYYYPGTYVKANPSKKIPINGTVSLSNYYGGEQALPPVDAVVSQWSAWGPCSKNCGGGTQTRTRTVLAAARNGGNTPVLTETQPCNTGSCPPIAIMSENFSTATQELFDTNQKTWTGPDGRSWTWKALAGSGPASCEPYSAANAAKRGMPTTHGGFEVASRGGGSGATWAVSTTLTVPATIDNSKDMEVWCSVGHRRRVVAGAFECVNLTTKAICCPKISTGGSVGSWLRVRFIIRANTFKSGDNLELRWIDNFVDSATGLQAGAISVLATPK